jgi:hypothetical protein
VVRRARLRLWLLAFLGLLRRGLWAGSLVLAAAGIIHWRLGIPSPATMVILACLPPLAALTLGLFRRPALDTAARAADRWLDADALLLSAWHSGRASERLAAAAPLVLAQARRAAPRWETRLGEAGPVLRVSTLWPPLAAAAAAAPLVWLEPAAEPADLSPASASHPFSALAVSERPAPSLDALVEELRTPASASEPGNGTGARRAEAGAGVAAAGPDPGPPPVAGDDPVGTTDTPTGSPIPTRRVTAAEARTDTPASWASPAGTGGDGSGADAPGEAYTQAQTGNNSRLPEEIRAISRRGLEDGSVHGTGMPLAASTAALPPAVLQAAAPAEVPEGILTGGPAHGPERGMLLDRFFEILRQDHDHQ